MTTPRRTQISLDDTPYYHCISRCVRRAFLCGKDRYSGQDFSHRRQWLLDRIKQVAAAFAVDIAAYAIMNNHYHLVLRVDRKQAQSWTDHEVIERWCTLFRGPLLVQGYLCGEALSAAEGETVSAIAGVWRKRLMDISWYMRCLNEYVARQANREDGCTGRFWEGRFKAQALLDDRAVLSCMAYVDLNPVRAGLAQGLTDSDFTSIQERLWELSDRQQRAQEPEVDVHTSTASLLPFTGAQAGAGMGTQLPVTLRAYIELVDWTGRVVRADKRGAIARDAPPALRALQLDSDQWLELTLDVQRRSVQAVGHPAALARFNQARGRRWSNGQSMLGRVYGSP
ncbi:transposase [Halieaceae bacterium IMCC14734]|uniref:Transposase n=1 Tax=Candidatus Litorirhabdus singularis TaxID=2518993 RepID=A0ABT3TM81_9GAMM|nr:transposase [Candidatus Litorirhabdus singularis]MCX2983437.1 transposase [Candidatus Litorirhabdus singularis]